MDLTVPPPGDGHVMDGFVLQWNKGDPILTVSPCFTKSLGLIPLKSVGSIATEDGDLPFTTSFTGVPAI